MICSKAHELASSSLSRQYGPHKLSVAAAVGAAAAKTVRTAALRLNRMAEAETEVEAAEALATLGRHLLALNFPLRAARCLDAAARCECLPAAARARLAVELGEVLVLYTDSDALAKSTLTGACSELKQAAVPQHLWLARCQLALASLHSRASQRRHELLCLSSALAHAQHADSACWELAARSRLARTHFDSGDSAASFLHLQHALSAWSALQPPSALLARAALYFTCALLSLRSADIQSAHQHLQQCESDCASLVLSSQEVRFSLARAKLRALCAAFNALMSNAHGASITGHKLDCVVWSVIFEPAVYMTI